MLTETPPPLYLWLLRMSGHHFAIKLHCAQVSSLDPDGTDALWEEEITGVPSIVPGLKS